MEEIKVFGQNIRIAREYRGYSIVELANLASYNRFDLSTIENGEHDLLLSTALKVSKALDVDFPSLLSRNFNIVEAKPFIEDSYYSIFSENIYRFIEEKQVNQSYFHSKVNIPDSNVNRILKKKVSDPKLGTLIRIASVFVTEPTETFRRKIRRK